MRVEWHLPEASLQERSGAWGYLVDDIDAISKLLPLQKGVQVVEQEAQVVLPSTVGHNDGCSGAGLTPCRAVPAAWFHSGIPLHNLHQRWHRAEGHRHGTHCWERLARLGIRGARRKQGSPGTGNPAGSGAQLPHGLTQKSTSLEFPITGAALHSLEGAGSLPSLLSFMFHRLSCLTRPEATVRG